MGENNHSSFSSRSSSFSVFCVGVLFLFLLVVGGGEGQATPGVYFGKLGTAGSYQLVTAMLPGVWPPPCAYADNVACTQIPFIRTAANLAPFDEEVDIHLRGPQNLKRIYVYQQTGSSYTLTSSWTAGGAANNISFLSNSGDWTVCQGNAVGYTNQYGNASSTTPVNFNGWLADGLEIIVQGAVPCANNDCGYYRGSVGLHAWSGDKIFVFETSMPFATNANPNDKPAIWSLNAKISRTAQYGCNCNREGCGEFDISEVINTGDTKAYMTLYSYNGDLGTPAYFPRPTTTSTVYFVHYSVADNRIYALNFPTGCFSYANTLSQSYVNAFQGISVDAATFSSKANTNSVFTCPSAGSTTTTAATSAAATSAAATTAKATTTTTGSATTTKSTTTTASSGSTTSSLVIANAPKAVLQSKSNGLYVVADPSSSILHATASSVSAATVFDLATISGGYTIKNDATSQFTTAENGGASALVSNRPVASGWETFVFTAFGAYYAITATANNEYVTLQSDNSLLAATATSVSTVPDSALWLLVCPSGVSCTSSSTTGAAPTPAPTAAPTPAPTAAPTPAPTHAPTPAPTAAPTPAPTAAPTTHAPTPAPTAAPTSAPTPSTLNGAQALLKSKSNGNYVVVDPTSLILHATATSLCASTTFDLATISGGYSLKNDVSSQYTSADNTGTTALVSNRVTASGWETFAFTLQTGNYYTLTALANNQLVTLQSDNSLLASTATSVSPIPATALWSLVSPSTSCSTTSTRATTTTTATSATLTTSTTSTTSSTSSLTVSNGIQGILQSQANGQFVSADSSSILHASVTAKCSAVTIDFASITGGYTLKNDATSQYTTAENAGASALVSNRPTASTWETFAFTQQSGGYYTITSLANNQLVTLQSDNSLLPSTVATVTPIPSSALWLLVSPGTGCVPSTTTSTSTGGSSGSGSSILFVNKCSTTTAVYYTGDGVSGSTQICSLATGASCTKVYPNQGFNIKVGPVGLSLAEFQMNSYAGLDYYDLSEIVGYDVPMGLVAPNGGKTLTCVVSTCVDAYHLPNDVATHTTPTGGQYTLTFCP